MADSGTPMVDFGPLIAALERNSDTIASLGVEVHDTNRRSIFQTVIIVIQAVMTIALIVLVIIGTFVVSSIRSQQKVNARTFNAVIAATGPAAQARSASAIVAIEAQVEHCIINHVDHDNIGAPLDPKCPAG